MRAAFFVFVFADNANFVSVGRIKDVADNLRSKLFFFIFYKV